MSKYNVYFATIFILTSSIATFTRAENILFLFPIATTSHTNVFNPLISALASRGHNLTVFTPNPSKKPVQNITEFSPISVSHLTSGFDDPFVMRKKGIIFFLMSDMVQRQLDMCSLVINDENFKKVMSASFDLIVINGFLNDCLYGHIHKLGAPFIIITTVAAPSLISRATGNYLPPAFTPFLFLPYRDEMSFMERTINYLVTFLMDSYSMLYAEKNFENFYKEILGNETPAMNEIRNNVSLILMNSHFSMNYPRPNLPDNVEVGGMHCRPSKPLPKDLDDFLSGAEHGFIYFSLGSIVKGKTMPEEYRKIFLKVFSKLKQRVIWKWEEEMENIPPNVKISSWLPQQDILGHPNIKLFMTHGGLLSTQESIYHGVPLLGMPIFGDQNINMMQAETKGYALTQEFLTITEEDLEQKIKTLLEDQKYTMRARELSTVFKDQTETPIERAVFWSEYVMRNKGAHHLRSAARKLNYAQANSYDVIGFILLVLLASTFTSFFILRKIIKCLLKKTPKTAQGSKDKKLKKK